MNDYNKLSFEFAFFYQSETMPDFSKGSGWTDSLEKERKAAHKLRDSSHTSHNKLPRFEDKFPRRHSDFPVFHDEPRRSRDDNLFVFQDTRNPSRDLPVFQDDAFVSHDLPILQNDLSRSRDGLITFEDEVHRPEKRSLPVILDNVRRPRGDSPVFQDERKRATGSSGRPVRRNHSDELHISRRHARRASHFPSTGLKPTAQRSRRASVPATANATTPFLEAALKNLNRSLPPPPDKTSDDTSAEPSRDVSKTPAAAADVVTTTRVGDSASKANCLDTIVEHNRAESENESGNRMASNITPVVAKIKASRCGDNNRKSSDTTDENHSGGSSTCLPTTLPTTVPPSSYRAQANTSKDGHGKVQNTGTKTGVTISPDEPDQADAKPYVQLSNTNSCSTQGTFHMTLA